MKPTAPALPSRPPTWPVTLTSVALLAATVTSFGAAGAAAGPTPTASPTASPTVAAPLIPLPAPTGLSPRTSSIDKTVVLRWAPVTGATGYLVEVGTDDQWSDNPVFTGRSVADRLTLPVWLPHASYVWRVSALQTGGHGRWSTAGSFTRGWTETPALLSPAPDEAAVGMPEFRWTPVPGASSYELQISTTTSAGSDGIPDPAQRQGEPVTNSCFTNRTSITPYVSHGSRIDGPGDCILTNLGGGRTRSWRVRALDRFVGAKLATPVDPVTVEGISTLPPVFVSDQLDLSPCPAAPRTGGPSSQPAGPPPLEAAPEPTDSPSPAPATSASPQPTEAAGDCQPAHPSEKGAWSGYRTFSVTGEASGVAKADLPLVATKSLPAGLCNAERVCRDFPTLSWEPAAGASAYRVYLSLASNYSNIVAVSDTPGLRWTPRVSLRDNAAGRAYYYAVQACSSDGCGPVPARPESLRKLSPPLAATGRVDGASVGAGGVSLSWQSYAQALAAATGEQATSDAYAYRVQVTTAANPDFQGGLVEDVTVDETSYVSPTKSYPDGRLLWRVQAIDANGNRLPWSVPRSLVRDTVAPVMTVTGSPVPVAGPLVVRFSEEVIGLSAASLTLSPTTPLRTTVSGRSATITPTRPLVPGAAYTLTVAAADRAGNPAGGQRRFTVDATVDDASPALRYGGGWTRRAASNAIGRTFRTSSPTPRATTSVSAVVHGSAVSVLGCVGPAQGLLEIWVDGVRRRRVDTYRSYSGCGVTVGTVAGLPRSDHAVRLVGVGARRPASRGTAVSLDALRVR